MDDYTRYVAESVDRIAFARVLTLGYNLAAIPLSPLWPVHAAMVAIALAVIAHYERDRLAYNLIATALWIDRETGLEICRTVYQAERMQRLAAIDDDGQRTRPR